MLLESIAVFGLGKAVFVVTKVVFVVQKIGEASMLYA